MTTFDYTHIEGYASIPKETFKWDKPGLNIIQAPNGHGKSKFIDALCWCLFGSSLSGSVEPWTHRRHKDFQGTMVKTGFKSEAGYYTVIRCKDYKGKVNGAKGNNRLILLHDDDEIREKKKTGIQTEINNILGYSFNLFINSVIFGQKIKRLITETGPNKKKVFEEAFEMSYIPKAKAIVTEEKKAVELTYYKQKSKVENIQEKLQSKKEALESEQKMVDSFDEENEKEIAKIQEELDDNFTELHLLEKPFEDEEYLNRYLKINEKKLKKINETQLNKDIGKTESEIERLIEEESLTTNQITKLEDSLDLLPESCSNCGKKFTKREQQSDHKRIKDQVLFLQQGYLKLIDLLGSTRGQLKQLNSIASSITSLKENIDSYNDKLEVLASIKVLTEEGESLQAKIDEIKEKRLKNSTKKYTRDIRKLKKGLRPEKKLMKKLKGDLQIKDWLINDPLSNNGLKAFIFNRMLDKLNNKLAYYSKYIPFKVLFDLDMDSAHKNIDTYVMDGEDPVPFDDLSGGQQQAVNIATAFAVHDIVSEGKECNLLVMDELFEGLDKENIEIMAELIQDKAKDKSLFLVTHRTAFNPTNANIIQISYKNKFTSLAS